MKAQFVQCGESIDYTPVSAVSAGDVVLLGSSLVTIAKLDIAAGILGAVAVEGVFNVVKDNSDVTGVCEAYWDADGSPVGGVALSGAFSKDATKGPFAGYFLAVAGTTVGTCLMALCSRDSAVTLARSALVQDDLQPYPILNESWYLFDSTTHAPLGATALSADDLIYTYGAAGTAEPKLTGTDFGGSNATQKARVRLALPPEYVAGQTITLRANAFTGTTVADTSSTIDFNVYRAAAPTVDICATAAQSINSLTAADKDFTITPTDCVPGDVLDILMTYAGTDGGNLGVIVPTINSVVLLLDVKG